mmetsp:Transcript_4573/g.10236  ORF Transcript_4573/g.10236 Transcript_4573/m.10236 type:complete len:126 (-) Transcript_4573:123-500(-)
MKTEDFEKPYLNSNCGVVEDQVRFSAKRDSLVPLHILVRAPIPPVGIHLHPCRNVIAALVEQWEVEDPTGNIPLAYAEVTDIPQFLERSGHILVVITKIPCAYFCCIDRTDGNAQVHKITAGFHA